MASCALFRHARDQQVPATARYRQVVTHDLHAWADRLTLIDRITQIPVRPPDIGADVADRGEAGGQRDGGILFTDLQLLFTAARIEDPQIGRIGRPVGQVGVHIDQPGQAGVGAQFEKRQLTGRVQAVLERFNPPVAYRHRDIAARGVGRAIDQRPAMHGD